MPSKSGASLAGRPCRAARASQAASRALKLPAFAGLLTSVEWWGHIILNETRRCCLLTTSPLFLQGVPTPDLGHSIHSKPARAHRPRPPKLRPPTAELKSPELSHVIGFSFWRRRPPIHASSRAQCAPISPADLAASRLKPSCLCEVD
jgi:hypothetical protein